MVLARNSVDRHEIYVQRIFRGGSLPVLVVNGLCNSKYAFINRYQLHRVITDLLTRPVVTVQMIRKFYFLSLFDAFS